MLHANGIMLFMSCPAFPLRSLSGESHRLISNMRGYDRPFCYGGDGGRAPARACAARERSYAFLSCPAFPLRSLSGESHRLISNMRGKDRPFCCGEDKIIIRPCCVPFWEDGACPPRRAARAFAPALCSPRFEFRLVPLLWRVLERRGAAEPLVLVKHPPKCHFLKIIILRCRNGLNFLRNYAILPCR